MKHRLTALAGLLVLAACGDAPTEPTATLDVAPAFELHPTPTAGLLEDPSEAYDEVAFNTFARHTPGGFDGDRYYMRTVATDYNEKDFVAELVFTLSNLGSDGATITYFGMGPGTPDPAYFNESSGALFRIHAPDIGFTHVALRNEGFPVLFQYINNLTANYGPSGSTHRAILTKAGSTLTFGFDKYNNGSVDATDVVDLASHPGFTQLNNTNSRIFFGTSTQDGFTLTITHDRDGDGVSDDVDNCVDTPNPGQLNTDGDAQGDACDPDDDNDGLSDAAEAVLGTNPLLQDTDVDSVLDGIDNCPVEANADQANYDGDGQGDACDSDDDNDNVPDAQDAVPFSNTAPTVSIGGCNSGVGNQVTSTGATFNDLIAAAKASARNHGAFVKAVANLTDGWKKAGMITGRDEGAITSCAARSK